MVRYDGSDPYAMSIEVAQAQVDSNGGASEWVVLASGGSLIDPPEASRHHAWELPSRPAIYRCELAARTIESALGKVPFGWIDCDHG